MILFVLHAAKQLHHLLVQALATTNDAALATADGDAATAQNGVALPNAALATADDSMAIDGVAKE